MQYIGDMKILKMETHNFKMVHILSLFIFFLPLENIVVVKGLGTIGRLIGIAVTIILLASIILSKQKMRMNSMIVVAFCFSLVITSSFLWTINPTDTLTAIITSTQILIFVWILSQATKNYQDIKILSASFVTGCLVTSFLVLKNFKYINIDQVERLSLSGFNPNDLALILSIGVSLSPILISVHENTFMKTIGYASLFLCPLSIFLTGSRSGFIAISIFFILYLTYKLKSYGFLSKILTVSLLALAFYISLNLTPEYLKLRLFSIFESNTLSSMNGRVDIWKNGFNILSQHPILGSGAGTFDDAMSLYYGTQVQAHNFIVNIFVEHGIIGIIPVLLLISVIIFKLMRMDKEHKINFVLPFIIILIPLLIGNWILKKQTWFIFTIIVIYADFYKHKMMEPDVIKGK